MTIWPSSRVKSKNGPDFKMAFTYQTPGELLAQYAPQDPQIAELMAQPPRREFTYYPGLE